MKIIFAVGVLSALVCGAQDLPVSNVASNDVQAPDTPTPVVQVSEVKTNDVPPSLSNVVTNAVSSALTNDVSPVGVASSLPFAFSNALFKAFEHPKPISDSLSRLFEKANAENLGAIEACRSVLIESLREEQVWAGIAVLRGNLLKRAVRLNWADPVALDAALFIASCAGNLEAFQGSDISPDVWAWLLASNERVRLVAATLTEDDNALEVSRIIQKLYEHDPDDRDRFFNLILAMAVVWDTPRIEMHKQIGEGWLPPDEDVCLYYDYFKKLFNSSEAKVPYADLSVDSLVFIVDIPAPVCELEWSLKNVKGSRALWGNHYKEIIYDRTRIFRKLYHWPHRDYTLQEIQECFGICVDQAYYSVITARAHGIPSLYFHGRGKYGGHAWFGFMKKKTEWDLNIGRYSDQGYAIGFAIHPQTDREMTDHELKYFCSRALQPKLSRDAFSLAYLAKLFYEEDFAQGALLSAQRARQIIPLCEEAWKIECDVLVDTEAFLEAIELLKKKAVCFKYYPDVVSDARQRQAVLLSRIGDAVKAEKILGLEVARVASGRDDLQQELVMAQAEKLLEQGKAHKGLEVIERVLREQRGGGRKIYALISEYKKFAKRAGVSKSADRFLKTYYR